MFISILYQNMETFQKRNDVLQIIEKLYHKYREMILYFVFGCLTTILSIVSFEMFFGYMRLRTTISNVISWIIAVSFAFFTNRLFVFKTSRNTKENAWHQGVKFFVGRIVTLILETILLLLMIDTLSFDSIIAKIIAQIVVFISNFLISKLIVFRK